MTSILTNIAAMSALESLSETQKNLQTTQNRISTGLRVATAADNAAYWSIATTMRSDSTALSTVSDALNIGASTVTVASNGMTAAIDVVNQIKAKLIAAQTQGVDRTKIQSDITQLQNQLKSISDSASFNGQNWLSVDPTADSGNTVRSIVASYSDANGVGTITYDAAGSMLFDTASSHDATQKTGLIDGQSITLTGGGTIASGTKVSVSSLDISNLTDSSADQTDLTTMINGVNSVISKMTQAGADLGSVTSRVTLQQSFVTKLKDAIDQGVGALVDADMNAESAKLQALQVQQQLGVQSLSIANANNQVILKLFQ